MVALTDWGDDSRHERERRGESTRGEPGMAVANQQQPGVGGSPRRAVRGAAHWRKRLRRELLRVGAANVSVYVDGPRGIVHMRFPEHGDRINVDVREALRLLSSLPDGAGVETTLKALGRP
jgi:hypothetical protein